MLFKVGPREFVRLVNLPSGTHAQKTTGWPFVLEFLVDFVHLRPAFGGVWNSVFCLLDYFFSLIAL